MEEQNTNTATPIPEPLPGAVLAFVFGIISIGLFWLGVYFIVPGLIPLIFGIVAMIKGGKAGKIYLEDPNRYAKVHGVFAKIGRILGLVGWILSVLFMVIFLIILLVAGSHMF